MRAITLAKTLQLARASYCQPYSLMVLKLNDLVEFLNDTTLLVEMPKEGAKFFSA